MSRISNDDIAAWAAGAITYTRGMMDGYKRSPAKVDNLIRRHLMRDDVRYRCLDAAIAEMRDVDTHIHSILCELRAHHTLAYRRNQETKKDDPVVSWVAASETWEALIRKLKNFAAQTGGQRMLPAEDMPQAIAELRAWTKEMLKKASK